MACKGTVPSFAVSIGAAVRRRFRRLFRLNRSTPCALQAAPAGRPVRSAPFQGSCGSCAKAGVPPASPLKRSLLLTVIPALPLLKICFFHTPAKNTPRPASSTAAREAERFSFQISSETAARNSAAPGKRLSEERGKGACAFAARGHSKKRFRPAYCVSTICTVGSSMRISSTAPFSLRPSTTACAFSCRA